MLSYVSELNYSQKITGVNNFFGILLTRP